MPDAINRHERTGPMGWGTGEPLYLVRNKEKKGFDHLAEVVPQYMQRREAKERNADLLAEVDDLQQQNGIEEGFCFLHLVEAVFGSQFQWLAQLIGSCVASGDGRNTAYRMLAEVFVLNDPETLPGIDITGRDSLAFFMPFNYGAGRYVGNMMGGGDGSYCSVQIEGKMRFGHLPCSTPSLTSDTFPEPQSQSLYRRWGRDPALFKSFSDQAGKCKLIESEKVTAAGEMKTLLLEHLKPANICSSWGFAPDYQHPTWKLADGSPVYIYKRSGSWAHNMSVIGFVKHGEKWYVIIENSWGMNAHRNGSWFAIPASLFDSWLRQAQCQSVGEIDLTDNAPPWPEG